MLIAAGQPPRPQYIVCGERRGRLQYDPTWSNSIEENRPTLEQLLRYTHEQGIAHRRAQPEEIFPKGIMTSVKV
jgi:4,5-dihydroxyphthalate decarboxylase